MDCLCRYADLVLCHGCKRCCKCQPTRGVLGVSHANVPFLLGLINKGGNYRTFAKNETHLMEQLEDDLWSLLDTCYEPDTLDDEVFPFYIIDTDTKMVVKKIGLSIVHAIKTEILD